jgi:hypothetical protein
MAEIVHNHPEAHGLQQLSDQELIRRASREMAMALILCSRALIEGGTELVSSKPKEGLGSDLRNLPVDLTLRRLP